VDWGNRYAILHRLLDVENSEGHSDTAEDGGLGEVHTRADAATESKTDFAGVQLRLFLWCSDVALRSELEGLGIGLRVVEHIPGDPRGRIRNAEDEGIIMERTISLQESETLWG
jgi:hypothetical protein